MNTLKKLAEEARKGFFHEEVERSGKKERIWKLRPEHRPEYGKPKETDWLYEMVLAAHDDGQILPDDFRYEYVVDALDMISEGRSLRGIQDRFDEIEADVYTADLKAWLSSSNRRQCYVDDATENYGKMAVMDTIGAGQIAEKREVAEIVLRAVTDEMERRDEAEAEEAQ